MRTPKPGDWIVWNGPEPTADAIIAVAKDEKAEEGLRLKP